jgi:energy-converting hydrogenase Eha subunit B
MGRNILAVVLGIVAAGVTVFLVEIVGHFILPAPPGVDPTNPESLRANAANLPLASLVAVLIAWCAGSFVGGLVAALVSREQKMLCALIAALFVIGSGVATMVMIPHPIWFWIAAILLPLPFAWFGARLAGARSPEPATSN